LYGPTLATEFGPLALKAFQRALLDERIACADPKAPPRRLSRPYINRALQWVRRLFRWAVGEQLLPPNVLQALQAVDGLKVGRTDAPEPPPVRAIADAVVEATLPHLSTVVADMVRLQRLTGMRPGEVCRMTTGEIDTTGEVWLYQPREHKTAHFGHSRSVPLGPKAQDIVRRYLRQALGEPIFSPRALDAERRHREREENRTPFTPSRLRRDAERARKPRRQLNDRYTTTNYAQAIRRACDDAGVPRWTPNQLRHSKATELRKRFGLDAAGAVLGHSKLETTQIYAERATELGAKVALATG
jgi:integrase